MSWAGAMDAIDLFSKYLSKNDCSMNENLKMGFIVAIILIVCWGIFGLIDGKGFFDPTIEIIDEVGNTISFLIKVALVGGIIWFLMVSGLLF